DDCWLLPDPRDYGRVRQYGRSSGLRRHHRDRNGRHMPYLDRRRRGSASRRVSDRHRPPSTWCAGRSERTGGGQSRLGAARAARGHYEVVLEPTAVADVLSCLCLYGFDGKAVNEQRSFLKAGESQFDPSISIVDDAVSNGSIGLPFDSEGTPKRRVQIVTKGL